MKPGAVEGEIVVNTGYAIGNYSSVFVDSSGNIYIAEQSKHRVTKWAPGSTEGEVVAGGVRGSSLSQLNDPSGVFVDSSGNIFIGDSQNYRVVKWEPGASEGSIVAGGNGQGNALNQLNYTYKVHVHSSGDFMLQMKVIIELLNGHLAQMKELLLPEETVRLSIQALTMTMIN